MTDISFLTREPSFSFLYFTGDVYEFIPTLLTSRGYAIIGQAYYEASFLETLSVIDRMEGPRNTIVHKAAYRVPGGTVLLDPEMTVGIGDPRDIVRFCAAHSVETFVAIWERFSETVIGRHLTSEGVRAEVRRMRGVVQGAHINPPPSFTDQTDPACLKSFLADVGVPVDAIFGPASAWLFKLDESGMSPRLH